MTPTMSRFAQILANRKKEAAAAAGTDPILPAKRPASGAAPVPSPGGNGAPESGGGKVHITDPHRFAHLRQPSGGAEEASSTPGRAFAERMLGTAAAARGEGFDASKMVDGPDQTRRRVTGADLLQSLRRMGRAAKEGEGL